jgi:GMP synthase-like glutamine amidotransferase
LRSSKIHLGILDTVPSHLYQAGEKKEPEKFVEFLGAVDASMSFSIYDAAERQLPKQVDDCDAYLITGSPSSAYEQHTWINELEAFVRDAYSVSKPLIGICFGHQIIAQSLGGRVRRSSDGWLIGLHSFDVYGQQDRMTSPKSRCALYFINQDQVVELPPDVELLAGSEACPNAMYCVDGRILSIQGHPEQPLEAMRDFTRRMLEDRTLSQADGRASFDSMDSGEPDSILFANWIHSFLRSC